ncbi:TonB-dependent receptor [Pseudoalteromonas sp. NBT06-2]|uniref:TonB-dependent receptor plug domain-containing protein n=1 Tax=Pseudoalteromonas sp. NBT06-2 TaxID=2025950 RepID=UPI000BA5D3E3|nr:TonB-dependent receptor [Pseudoalteromonas sp. NBT06-2]PAJ71872.1 TonB-dependent receptor [Pseudoalteromonas sp. NBT06-2]
MISNKLAKAVRLAMAFGAASTVALSANVSAADEGAEEVERIEVTGSRIKRTDMESASPVTVITAEQMKVAGIQDVGQFLQSSAVMSGSPTMTTTNNGGNGGTFVELRGLGSSRTLVLVNGRRPVTSDFQSIPSSMIKRIEVLKDGASATYGADAVAGVVNIITRKDFEGAEVTVQMKNSFDVNENKQDSISFVAGKAFDAGHIVVGIDYVEQEAVYQGDTSIDFMNYPWQVWGEDEEASFWKNGLIGANKENANVIVVGSGSVPCGHFYFASERPNQTNDKCDGGIASLEDMRDFVGNGPNNDTYNYAPVNYLQTPYKKLNFFVEGSLELGDSVSMYTETRINKRTSRQELAAVPYDTRYDPAYSGTLPDGTAFNGVSKDNFYNPFGEDVIRSRRRMLEGGRSFEQDIIGIQQVIGFEGDFGDGYYYDVNYNYGYQQDTSTDFGQLYGPNLAKAMGPSFKNAEGNIVCGTSDAPISDCVSMNVFGGPGSVTQEMLDYVSAPLVDSSNYTLQTLTAFVGGDVFELPGGIVSGGVGFEWRSEKAEAQVDSGKFMREVTGNKSKGTNGSYNVTSLFAEVIVPVVDGLEIPLGVRYDDFSAFGDSTTYQIGAEWKPMDGLLVRGTYGTVFRAPGISSLYSPANDSFPSATDPCRQSNWGALTSAQQGYCQADGVPDGGSANEDGQQLAASGGNPNLKPEEGDTFTLGFAYSPDFVEGLGITLDYWAIDIEKVIDTIGAFDSLKGCYLGGISALCGNIGRTNGEITYLNASSSNLSRMTAKGIDFEANYGFEALGGDIKLNLSMTHFLERENQNYNADSFKFEMEDLNGLFENDTSYFTNKINFNASYQLDNLTLNYATNYMSGLEYTELLYWGTTNIDPDDANSPLHKYEVDSMMYHDVSAVYSLETGTTVSVGITNLTDEQPHYIEPAFNGNTDESNYRLMGRSWYLRLNQTF